MRLPARRGQKLVRIDGRHEQMRTAGRNRDARAQVRLLKLRIEALIGAIGRVEELPVEQAACLRPDLWKEQHLAPARRAEDDIGHEAMLLLQHRGGSGHGLSAMGHFRECLRQPEPFGIEGTRLPWVAGNRDLDRVRVVASRQRQHLMPARNQGGRKVHELAGKILVDEENAHAAALVGYAALIPAPRPRHQPQLTLPRTSRLSWSRRVNQPLCDQHQRSRTVSDVGPRHRPP